jgi:hypothetical protein
VTSIAASNKTESNSNFVRCPLVDKNNILKLNHEKIEEEKI